MHTKTASDAPECALHIPGTPNDRQREFFACRARYVAYGGARGGGKSWALRRKLILMCLRYPGLRCLLVRRTLPELRSNHLAPLLAEYGAILSYSERDRELTLENGSRIILGYCAAERDALRYQGQEYDVIAIDEATQLSEYQFTIFKACLRGTRDFPRRIYLTCNPGGVGHSWVKRLFIDRDYRLGENPEDYAFIPATVFDNGILTRADPDYVRRLETLPPRLRDAWLYGKWDIFEGQFFTEFDEARHVCAEGAIPRAIGSVLAFDYGFDMLAAYICICDGEGRIYVTDELCAPGLTLGDAAARLSELCHGKAVDFAVASPDLWNRRQDSGKSGFEIMQSVPGMPPMRPADDRRVPGWRLMREYLADRPDGKPGLLISRRCRELIRCLPALLFDKARSEDASGEPHSVTHSPEALRYALMSRFSSESDLPPREEPIFRFRKKENDLFLD
jgi:phage terminase large subunit